MSKGGIVVTKQRKNWDCGIASLAMLLSVDYADVSATARAIIDAKRLKRNGVTMYEMEAIAANMGHGLTRHYKAKNYLENKTGIIGLLGNGKKMPKYGHWAVLKDGTHIVDPDGGEIWKLEDYLIKWQCRTATLLTL